MKPNIRWQMALALACLALILALLSFQIQTSGLCTTRVPADGGMLAEGIIGSPNYINPLLSNNNPVDRELAELIFDGLTRYNAGGELEPALAESWEVGPEGRSVTFTLRDDAVWHDGEPVTADDVVFSYSLLKDPLFPAPESLRTLWQNISISSEDSRHVTFSLPEPYAPFMEMTTRGIIPAHILEDTPPNEIADHRFNQFPIGTGPFAVNRDENWTRTGRLQLMPNTSYWPQGTRLAGLEIHFFQDNPSLMEAYRAGEIQAINSIPPSLLPDYLSLPGLMVYTAPADRYSQLLFNMSDTGMAALDETEVRRALALGLNRDQLLDGTLSGQGLPLEGPYLPSSWIFDSATLTQYAYDPASAVAALDSAGWTIPEGSSLRQKTGAPFELRLLFWDVPPYREIAEGIVRDWERLNIRVSRQPHNLEGYRQALAERAFDAALVDVTPPGDPDLYDFWSQEAIVRGQNYAGWNNRRASEALEQARQVWPIAERAPFYQAFLAYFDNELPALTLFQYVYNYGISEVVNEVEIGLIDNSRDRYKTLPEWFLLYRDVTVSCTEDATQE